MSELGSPSGVERQKAFLEVFDLADLDSTVEQGHAGKPLVDFEELMVLVLNNDSLQKIPTEKLTKLD